MTDLVHFTSIYVRFRRNVLRQLYVKKDENSAMTVENRENRVNTLSFSRKISVRQVIEEILVSCLCLSGMLNAGYIVTG